MKKIVLIMVLLVVFTFSATDHVKKEKELVEASEIKVELCSHKFVFMDTEGKPIKGVIVKTQFSSVTTDDNGIVKFLLPKSDESSNFSFLVPENFTYLEPIMLPSNTNSVYNFVLSRANYTLKFEVLSSNSSTILICDEDNTKVATLNTDENGVTEIDLPVGNYTYTITNSVFSGRSSLTDKITVDRNCYIKIVS